MGVIVALSRETLKVQQKTAKLNPGTNSKGSKLWGKGARQRLVHHQIPPWGNRSQTGHFPRQGRRQTKQSSRGRRSLQQGVVKTASLVLYTTLKSAS